MPCLESRGYNVKHMIYMIGLEKVGVDGQIVRERQLKKIMDTFMLFGVTLYTEIVYAYLFIISYHFFLKTASYYPETTNRVQNMRKQ